MDDVSVRTLLDLIAPRGAEVLDYDRRNLLIYAELLNADADGIGWEAGARTILGLEIGPDDEALRLCWDSHVARARWIVGAGLNAAITAFGN